MRTYYKDGSIIMIKGIPHILKYYNLLNVLKLLMYLCFIFLTRQHLLRAGTSFFQNLQGRIELLLRIFD